MSESRVLLLANLVLALFMAGVIWYVQIVHYPLFKDVGREAFPAFHAVHNNATTVVVALPMLIELGLAALLVIARPPEMPALFAVAAFGLVLVIWGATFLISVPIHARLSEGGYNITTIDALVNTNWIRTLAWSARSVLLTIAVFLVMR
jgi:hypothetical protein